VLLSETAVPEDPKRFIEKTGATRRNRTGDLLITNRGNRLRATGEIQLSQ
jgi:hypothetical protein